MSIPDLEQHLSSFYPWITWPWPQLLDMRGMLMWISHQLLIKPSAHSQIPCLDLHLVKSHFGVLKVVFKKIHIFHRLNWKLVVVFLKSIREQSHKKKEKKKSSRSDTQPLWHLTSRRGWLGTSLSVTLWLSNGQTLLTSVWLLLDVWYTSGRSVYSSTDCVMPSQMLWLHHHRYWRFECVCAGVNYFPSQRGMLPPLSIYYSLLLFTLPLSFCPPSSFWQTALSCFIQSSLVCPSIHPPLHGGLLMPDLAAHTSPTTRWEDLLIDPALSRQAGHAESPHNRVNKGGK